MGSNDIFIREYISSLKEDGELDHLFPILLTLLGFKIKSTPKQSKGQSQYGKDVVAVGYDENRIKKRFFFELKGFDDKDIDDRTFNKSDGIRDSILAAIDTPFIDNSDPEFNKLPYEIVIVHNGVIKENFRPQYNGFIQKNFPDGGYQDWDIYKLTELFSKYLFSEYLITDEKSLLLLKRTLVLLDAPENDFIDFKQLVNLQFEKISQIKGRAFRKFFATLNLLSGIIFHYSKENNNLYAARECLTYLLLKTWSWILKNKFETKQSVINEFRKILNTHYAMLDLYFKKTLSVAKMQNGLFNESGLNFESIGYPLRCFDYLDYLIYFFQARQFYPTFKKLPLVAKSSLLKRYQNKILIELINNNPGCSRILLDNHSISVLNVILFFLKNKNITDEELRFIGTYIIKLLDNIMIIKTIRNRFPELNNNKEVLAEFVAKSERPYLYQDKSTLVITILFELIALLNSEDFYKNFRVRVQGNINLQTAYPLIKENDIEQLLFEKTMHDEYFVEHSITLPENAMDFKEAILKKPIEEITYRTDKVGFAFLRTLAHIYFKNDWFPDEWRKPFTEINS